MKVMIKRTKEIREVKDRKIHCADGKIRTYPNYDLMNLKARDYFIIEPMDFSFPMS